jgi:prepilin-type N-terminal cleavage/methylation domain-containing protein
MEPLADTFNPPVWGMADWRERRIVIEMVRRGQAARPAFWCKDDRGYTLVELLIVLTIMLIAIGALADGFTSASRAEVDQSNRASDQQSVRQALDRMRKDIHCATNFTAQPINDAGGNPTDAWLLDLPIATGCLVDLPPGDSGVQWCTAKISTNRYGLYRTFETPANTSCDATNADFQVDYLIQSNVWTSPPPPCAAGQIRTVGVDLPVNRDYAKNPSRTYRLQDQIALRNASAC